MKSGKESREQEFKKHEEELNRKKREKEEALRKKEMEKKIIVDAMDLAVKNGGLPPHIPLELIMEWTDNKKEKIGSEGGFGTVYRGLYPSSVEGGVGQSIAVKHLDKKLEIETGVSNSKNTRLEDSVKREVKSLSQLRHPNIITLLGYSLIPGELYLIYELASEGDLAAILNDDMRACKIPWKKRVIIAHSICSALNYLHHQKPKPVIHRDIKLPNITLFWDGTVRVIDWGLAKYVPNNGISGFSVHTTGSVVFGTPGYQCPDVLDGNEYTISSEIFSFGVVLIELLSGKVQGYYKEGTKIINLARSVKKVPVDNRGGEWPKECADKFREIAASCVADSSERVPSLRNVIYSLNELKTKFCTVDISESLREEEVIQLRKDRDELRNAEILRCRGTVVGRKDCVICYEEVDVKDGISCSKSTHFYCKGCFSQFVKHQSGIEKRGDFENQQFCKVICDVCRHEGCSTVGCSGDNQGIYCVHKIYPFSNQQVAVYSTEDSYLSFLQALDQIKEGKILKDSEERFQKQLESIQAQILAAKNERERNAVIHRLHINKNILCPEACPRCRKAFTFVGGCFAIECSSCKCGFCGWCMKDCGDDAHKHVLSCPENKLHRGIKYTVFLLFIYNFQYI